MPSDDQWKAEQRYDGKTYYVNRETGERLEYESQEWGPAEAVLKDGAGNVKASGSVGDDGIDLKDSKGNPVYKIGREFDGFNDVPTLRDSSGSSQGSLRGGFLGALLNPFRGMDGSSDVSSGMRSGTAEQKPKGGHHKHKPRQALRSLLFAIPKVWRIRACPSKATSLAILCLGLTAAWTITKGWGLPVDYLRLLLCSIIPSAILWLLANAIGHLEFEHFTWPGIYGIMLFCLLGVGVLFPKPGNVYAASDFDRAIALWTARPLSELNRPDLYLLASSHIAKGKYGDAKFVLKQLQNKSIKSKVTPYSDTNVYIELCAQLEMNSESESVLAQLCQLAVKHRNPQLALAISSKLERNGNPSDQAIAEAITRANAIRGERNKAVEYSVSPGVPH